MDTATTIKRGIGFEEALQLTFANIIPAGRETVPLVELTDRVLAGDVVSKVDSPSVDASLKDGYALRSEDVKDADETNKVVLTLVGSVMAGGSTGPAVRAGQAVRITTGARLPVGADAVLAEEYCEVSGGRLLCHNTAEPGRNVLWQSTDIRAGQIVARAFDLVTPPLVGLLATAGIHQAEVFRNPIVCVMATGDEVVAPGKPLPKGSLYASNITEICAWLSRHRIPHKVCFARDTEADVGAAIEEHIDQVDAFVSSGGIWGSERDLMLQVLESRAWRGVYHRVRIGPGKAIAFGLLKGKPFFCLPGGPPSNEMAFLQIALPGLLRLQGHKEPTFPLVTARLTASVRGVSHWTQFIHALLEKAQGQLTVTPLKQKSRLQSMAGKNALIRIPEGCEHLREGEMVEVQLLDSQVLHTPWGSG